MLFVHLPVRLLVVPGDIIVHDHHVFSSCRKSPTAIYERQAHVRGGGWQHSWGIANWASRPRASVIAAGEATSITMPDCSRHEDLRGVVLDDRGSSHRLEDGTPIALRLVSRDPSPRP